MCPSNAVEKMANLDSGGETPGSASPTPPETRVQQKKRVLRRKKKPPKSSLSVSDAVRLATSSPRRNPGSHFEP